MKTLEHQSSYWNIWYHTDSQIIECEAVSAKHLDDDFFKSEMLIYAGIVEKYKAPRLLLDLSRAAYTISPEMQVWVEQNIATRTLGAGQNRIATLLSKDIFSALGTQQLMEEGIIATVQTRYFDDYAAAATWLKQG